METGALTIQESAQTTGWSPRMLRYIEEAGLVVPSRSDSGYRLYGPAELQRLRTLRHLLEEFGVELSDVGFALRMQRDRELSDAINAWLLAPAVRPVDVPDSGWLAYEQQKHLQLLAQAANHPRPHPTTPTSEMPSEAAIEQEMPSR